MTLQPGTRLGRYEVGPLLGRGGMGEVYRARDPRLDRDVAIKVLPDRLGQDPERLARFAREARLASALNHPNIVAIYDVGDESNTTYLAMELLEGRSLSTAVQAGPLPLKKALEIMAQAAAGLAAAHARGIVHRDLKPGNLFLTRDGVVKILDFGLARQGPLQSGPQEDTSPTEGANTDAGAILGTVGYMSPEQASGRPVQRQSDQFSLGAMLYEVLAGQRPFARPTPAETLAAIIREEPPSLASLAPATPAAVRWIAERCLAKDPADRYESTTDLARDLRQAADHVAEIPSGESAKGLLVGLRRLGAATPAQRPNWTTLVASLALLAVLGGLIYFGWRRPERGTSVPRLTHPIQATTAIGLEDYPTWSPDGRTLAYESSETGNWDIWVTQAGGGQSVNRTADHQGDDRYPSWSPDGRQIAFWSDRDGGGYYMMPALGGVARRLVSTPGTIAIYHSPPAWSADGTALAYVSYKSAGALFEAAVEMVSVVTREARQMPLPGSQEARLDLSWSRDGRYLAYVEAAGQVAETTRLWALRLSDGKGVALTDGRTSARSPSWSPDGRYLYFVSNRAGTGDLWRQRIGKEGTPLDEPQQVTTAIEIRHAGFSPDGNRLACSKGRAVSNVWRIRLREDRPATWADAEQMTFDQAFTEFVDLSRDGQRLAFSSDRTGNQDLWTMPIGGGEMQRLTADPNPEWMPRWSPDGSQIAFYSLRTGERKLWVVPATGGPARQLTWGPGQDSGPDWSPDGREIAFFSLRGGNADIWVVSADGTAARQVTRDVAGDYSPSWSPDGQWLTFYSTRAKAQIWRVSAAGGNAERLARRPGVSPRWSRDGKRIYFVGTGDRTENLWFLSLNDRSEHPATELRGRRGNLGFHAPATDGKYLYFTWRDDLGDVWVMDVAGD